MNLDAELVRAGRGLRDRLAELGAEVGRVEAELRELVGWIGAGGGSPAEIAAALGLDEQQVREWLRAAPGGPDAAAPGITAASGSGAAEGDTTVPGAWTRAVDPAAAAAAAAYGAALRTVAGEPDDAEDLGLGGPSRQPATSWTTLSCAFCGATQEGAGKLIAGPGVAICDGCARDALDLLVEGEGQAGGRLSLVGGDPQDRARCSFCGKRSRRVGRLVAGSGGVHICGECLDLCTEILREGLGR
jgi:hypothetical protein